MVIILKNWASLIANAIIPVAIIVFASGFFPYKAMLPGLARLDGSNSATIPPAIFDKVIFMVVDALRSDFVYSNSSGFLFTQSLIRTGAALPFTAHASAPTVTMPRLKAITTGSVPSFLDAVLNVAESDTTSTLANRDTWLAQLKAKGGRLVMYGDDTWLKLFPGMFDRSDGTTSFFVSDFVEVDNNVTRHIPDELLNADWTALIMHYLGLDHIGHKSGPRSPYMMSKHHEMDSIVAQIYTAMEEEAHLQSTLFILCGDHGMNDAGNHGGSSAGETSPALLFISPKFQTRGAPNESPLEEADDLQYYRTVEQSDITPTLAGLLGIPIPLNSLGVFIPELLMMWDHASHRVHILLENSRQLLRTVQATFPSYTFEPSLAPLNCDPLLLSGVEGVVCAWFRAYEVLRDFLDTGSVNSEIEPSLLQFSKTAQRVMSNAATNYDVSRLYVGLFISSAALLLSLWSSYKAILKFKWPGVFWIFGIMSYGAMMFASSYVEEEQQFWMQFLILTSMDLTAMEVTITSIFAQYVAFFAFGGSNAISSVDLSSAYNGIGSYNIAFVGFLTFVSNWAGPIWWSSASHLLLPTQTPIEKRDQISLQTLFVTMLNDLLVRIYVALVRRDKAHTNTVPSAENCVSATIVEKALTTLA
ncbi:major facilitator super transporter protein [Monascus purpureus]|uniref:GPI ethanolamine phosphate transferase 2 n=1 Tax=Monascus purpureus TaxID=5098 RepID=A0A507QYG2_MONPU|nr:major facilitator super transporter protein [Monascus purpureus]